MGIDVSAFFEILGVLAILASIVGVAASGASIHQIFYAIIGVGGLLCFVIAMLHRMDKRISSGDEPKPVRALDTTGGNKNPWSQHDDGQ